MNTFSDIGKIEAIERLYQASGFKVRDKASFLGGQDTTVRTFSRLWTEGIDFDLMYFPLKHLGYKTVIAGVTEAYASLARPKSLSVRLAVSSKLDFPQIQELWSGICTAAKEHSIEDIDLDLNPSPNGLTVSTVLTGLSNNGSLEGHASPKDLICISGNVGAAYLGLRLLERGKAIFDSRGTTANDNSSISSELEKYRMFVGAYLKPEIDNNIVGRISESGLTPSYGYSTAKGLADTARRLGHDCGLGVKLYTDKIPFEGNSFELGKKLDIDPISAAMNGGEDYRILFVVPLSQYETIRHDFQTFSIIGHIARPDVGTVLVTPDGVELPIRAQGWNNPK